MQDARTEPSFAGDEMFRRFADAVAGKFPAVLITIVKSSGSAPRKAGAKMLVTADAIYGSVGGGAIENVAVKKAREMLGSGARVELAEYDLGDDLAMGCGGNMSLFLESLTSQPRLIVFGGGHVGLAIYNIARSAGFAVTVCDTRSEWVSEERFPNAVARVNLNEKNLDESVEGLGITSGNYVVILTHSHAIDEEITKNILRLPEIPFYVGMIGSRRKVKEIRGRLAEAGIAQDRLEALHAPIGIPIGGVTPEEIAVSIVAELIAKRRGKEGVSKW